MNTHIKKHIKPLRLNSLPEAMRKDLKAARIKRDWSQLQLGQFLGLPQMHISGIETGKIVPRFDTLLDLVRILGYDLVMTPQSLIPAVTALIHDQNSDTEEERPLYANNEMQEEDGDQQKKQEEQEQKK